MTKKSTLKELEKLLKDNPNVNASQVQEAIDLLNALRAGGASDSQYNLVSPFDRRFDVERRAKHSATLDLTPR